MNYLSDHEFKGATTPGPERYFEDDDACAVTTRTSSRVKRNGSNITLRIPHKGLKKGYRFEKSEAPDVGSYDFQESLMFSSTMKKDPSQKFSKKENKRFTTLLCEAKAYIPGAGQYDIGPCFKKLSRPPSATRSRRH